MFRDQMFNSKYVIVICVIIIGFISYPTCARTQKVLVLHSYHQGLEWSDNISAGVKSVLGDRNNDVELYYDYLDTKRNAGDAYADKLVELFRAKSHHIPFDLVIAADNNALRFMREHGNEFYPDTPVVFCGVNYFSDSLISGMEDVTGVEEKADVKATMDLMLKSHPEARKILVVLDKSDTGLVIRKSVEEVADQLSNRAIIEFYTDFTWDSLREKLSSLDSDYLVYLLTVNRDRNQEFVSYVDGIDIVNKASNVPVYGSWDFYLGKGIVGGVITSGFEQGRAAAIYALKILSGQSARSLPIVRTVPNQKVMDFNLMQKFRIARTNLSSDVVIINAPMNLWQQFRELPLWVSISMPLSIIIISLAYLLNLQKIKNKYVLKVNSTLDKKVKEKTQEINASNNKMIQLISKLEEANQELEVTNKKLNIMSIKDSVTNIYNRRYISEKLTEEYQLAKQGNSALSILMLDIDYFKVINDSFGHQYGDYVLRTISQAITELAGESDIVGRYGGEEFLIVLPETPFSKASELAESIRCYVEAIDWQRDNLKVTISGGVAEFTGQPEPLMLRQADIALYRAKSHGRNMIV